MKLRALSFVVVAGMIGLTVRSALAQGIPCSYSVTVLPPHDCGLFQGPGNPHAINNLGHVLLTAPNCGTGYDETYIWTGGDRLTLIPRPAGMLGFSGFDLNDHGQIAGTAQMIGDLFGAIYDTVSQQWTFLEPPPTVPDGWSRAAAINNAGQACGSRTIGGPPDYPMSAFVWSPENGGTFQDLGLINDYSTFASDINESGTVAGTMAVKQVNHPFIWRRDGTVLDLGTLAGFETQPVTISDDDHVVGWGAITPGFAPQTRAFSWHDGVMLNLGALRGFNRSTAVDLSAQVIVGSCHVAGASEASAVIWIHERIYRLDDLVPSQDFVSGWAVAVSDDGRVVAFGFHRGEAVSALLTPIRVTGDVDGNCLVHIDDLLGVLAAWGNTNSPADLNGDNIVNMLDLMIVIEHWS